MDFRFDANVAERLIREIDGSCEHIQQDTIEILKEIMYPDRWDDNQTAAFRENIGVIAQDLNTALSNEDSYMRTFDQRVKELRG